LESRRTIPLQEATPEISEKLFQRNMAKLMKPLDSVQARYNERYFAAVAAAGSAPALATTKTRSLN
ncbi:MAG TPA: hypothetical protein VE783_08235, partial [Candidatus Limnocylindrales bacterium]|nr:hypothetical protein [Candidatus Limnocylindrales bacterium]